MFSSQRAGVPVTAHTSLQVDSVFTSLRVISNAFIKMGNPRAYTEALTADNEPYREWMSTQPLILTNTFGSPQRGSTPPTGRVFQYDGWRRTIISLGLFGEAWWLTLTRDRMGFPTMIQVLHPAFIDVQPIKSGPLAGNPQIFYGSGPDRRVLPMEDVTWMPFMAFPGAARGLSAIEYAGVAFALALAAMEYGQRWFAQGASPSYILSTDQKLGQEEVERIARKFLVEHSGLQAAHIPLVLDSGMKAEKISATPDEAQYLKTLEYARSIVAAWFGLPPHLVGGANDKGNVWGKTVAEQGMQMVDFTMSGYIIPVQESLSSLMPPGEFAAFDESFIQRADPASLAGLITAERSAGVVTQNEVRVHDLRRKPKPGGDELLVPMNTNASGPAGTLLATEAGELDPKLAPAPLELPPEPPEQKMARMEDNIHYLQEAVERLTR